MRIAAPARPARAPARLLLALSLLTLPAAAWAQDFAVTVGDKTDAHPNPGGSFDAAYYLDGVEGLELHLTRGVTYTFQMEDVPAMHPFYISTSSTSRRAPQAAGPASSTTASRTTSPPATRSSRSRRTRMPRTSSTTSAGSTPAWAGGST